MGEGFAIIGPNGRLTERADLLRHLRDAHSSWKGKPDSKIWIQNVTLRWETADLALLTYEEWQTIDGKTTSRLSSVLFVPDDEQPNGVQWRHLHETWSN